MNNKNHIVTQALVVILVSLSISGCKTRDGQEQTTGEAFQEYLREHSSPGWKAGGGWFVQTGRIEFYGPFPIELLHANKAFPVTVNDGLVIRESMLPVVANGTVLPNGQIVYPQVAQQLRSVRIAHMVRTIDGEPPKPSWVGPVIHERTEIPTRENGYLLESDTEPKYQDAANPSGNGAKTYNADGPSYRKADGRYQYGRMPYKGEEGPSPYWKDNQPPRSTP